MKNKKGNIALVAIIIAALAITISTITWIIVKKNQIPIQPQPIAPTAQTGTQTDNSTSVSAEENISWQPYTNVKNDFGFQYPGGWIIAEKYNKYGTADGIMVKVGGAVSEDTPPFTMSVTIHPVVYPSSKKAFDAQILLSLKRNTDHKMTELQFNGYDAVRYFDSGIFKTNNIVLSGKNNVLVISYLTEKEDDPVIKKMLSTFKLLK
ncbi:MAG: hypothetical protein NTZ97_02545 [Candidatus Moranbacteria bacterium]|nr:hypothetical protein [Candidatus Moranbacteria bacterium]